MAHYYKKYVEHTGISDNIFSQTTVTELHWLADIVATTTTTTAMPHETSSSSYHRYQIKGWRTLATTTAICGNNSESNIVPFEMRASSVLLACGMFDEPKRLGVPGESAHWIQHHPLVSHVQPSLPRSRELPNITTLPLKATSSYTTSMSSSFYYPDTSTGKNQQQQQLPYLVVGSGLSAADAIHRLRHQAQRVLHVFLSDRTYRSRKRSHASPPLAMGFTADTYPEYHATRRRMVRAQRTTATTTTTSSSIHDDMTWYEGLPDVRVLRFHRQSIPRPVYRVDLCLADGRVITRSIAGAIIVIGRYTRPQFLRGRLTMPSSKNTHYHQQHSITSNDSNTSNVPMMVEYGRPLHIDPWTSRVIDEEGNAIHPGLYAVGAITGDTTVRFILGASLGALIDLTQT
jgi:hypothetical protein